MKVSKSIIFLVKSLLGNFCRHLAIFYVHTDPLSLFLSNTFFAHTASSASFFLSKYLRLFLDLFEINFALVSTLISFYFFHGYLFPLNVYFVLFTSLSFYCLFLSFYCLCISFFYLFLSFFCLILTFFCLILSFFCLIISFLVPIS